MSTPLTDPRQVLEASAERWSRCGGSRLPAKLFAQPNTGWRQSQKPRSGTVLAPVAHRQSPHAYLSVGGSGAWARHSNQRRTVARGSSPHSRALGARASRRHKARAARDTARRERAPAALARSEGFLHSEAPQSLLCCGARLTVRAASVQWVPWPPRLTVDPRKRSGCAALSLCQHRSPAPPPGRPASPRCGAHWLGPRGPAPEAPPLPPLPSAPRRSPLLAGKVVSRL
jgi:hypothetical protein